MPDRKQRQAGKPTATQTGKRRNRRARRQAAVLAPGPQQTEVIKPIRNSYLRLTQNGRSWLRNYLNPCGEITMAEVGVPDGSSTMAAHKNSRVDASIGCPPDLAKVIDQANNTQGGNWWLCIVVPPWVDDCVILLATGVEPTKAPEGLFNILATVATYPSWTQVGTGAVTANTFFMARLPSPGLPVVAGANEDGDNVDYASQFRYTKRGITCHLIADDLTNRGSVTAAQWFCKPQPEVFGTRHASNSTTEAYITECGFAWSIMTGEITPTKLTAADERAYQGLAKEGCYMPVYRSGSDFTYQPYSQRVVFIHTTSDNADNPEVPPLNGTSSGGLVRAGMLIRKTIDHSQNIGVVWFRGVSSKATVRIKGRYSIQAVVEPGSPWAADSCIGPKRDDVALTTALTIQNDVAQAYPAHYNDWGWLGNVIKGLISKIPVIGGVASNLFEPLGTALGSVFGKK